jgi:hypothetical protein
VIGRHLQIVSEDRRTTEQERADGRYWGARIRDMLGNRVGVSHDNDTEAPDVSEIF